MKRLYIRKTFRGHKLGSRMIVQIIRVAKEVGYQLHLDTLRVQMKTANYLYRKFGFYEIDLTIRLSLRTPYFLSLICRTRSDGERNGKKERGKLPLFIHSSPAITVWAISVKHLAAGEVGIRVASPIVRKLSVENGIARNGAMFPGSTSSGRILMPR